MHHALLLPENFLKPGHNKVHVISYNVAMLSMILHLWNFCGTSTPIIPEGGWRTLFEVTIVRGTIRLWINTVQFQTLMMC